MKKNTILIFLLMILLSGIPLDISDAAEPTGLCINSNNEGIEYRIPIGLDFHADSLRRAMDVFVGDGTKGTIIGMEVEVATSRTRYQCTQVIPGLYEAYSCNSMPRDAKVNAVHLLYVPENVKEGETVPVRFGDTTRTVMTAYLTVRYPAPCSMNHLIKEFGPLYDEDLIINTADCNGNGVPGPADPSSSEKHKYVDFRELPANFRISNISHKNSVSDVIDPSRLEIDVLTKETYSYKLRLYFSAWDELVNGEVDQSKKVTDANYWVEYQYNEFRPYDPSITFSGSWYSDPVTQYKLPLTLVGGRLYDISTSRKTPAGDADYPWQSELFIRFWYENNTGVLGYENSVFHFERSMTVQFGPFCSKNAWTGTIFTGVSLTPKEANRKEKHLFPIDLTDNTGIGLWIPDNQPDCAALPYCRDLYSVYVTDAALDPIPSKAEKYYFAVKKCVDSSCSYLADTNAYLYSITVADGDNLALTYKSRSHSGGSTSVFAMKAYENSGAGHPFMLMKLGFMADEPGTYMVFGFLEPGDIKYNDLSHYAAAFYVNVGQSRQYAFHDGGYTISYASSISSEPVSDSTESVSVPEKAEKTGLQFAADEIELLVGESLPLEVSAPDGTDYMVMLGDEKTALYNEEEKIVTGLAEGEVTAYLADVAAVDLIDSLTIRVRSAASPSEESDGSGEVPEEETGESAETSGETQSETAAETETDGSADEENVLRFSEREITIHVGEQAALSFRNPEEAAVLVGLGGDTEAVLWDDLSLTVTGLTPGKVQAFLSPLDIAEVADICTIYVIADPENETETGAEEEFHFEDEPQTGPEISDPAETSTTGEPEEEITAAPVPTDEPAEEPDPNGQDTNTGSLQETAEEPAAETAPEFTEGPAADPVTRPDPEEEYDADDNIEEEFSEGPFAVEVSGEPVHVRPELNIRDLAPEGLQGPSGGSLILERDRFEVPDEIFTGLDFKIENEWIARLSEQSPEEILAEGIELYLLNPGETKLLIMIESEADPLLEIRISAVLPVSEEPEFIPEETPAPAAPPYAADPESPALTWEDPQPEEDPQISGEEPVYEFVETSQPEDPVYIQDPEPLSEDQGQEQGQEQEQDTGPEYEENVFDREIENVNEEPFIGPAEDSCTNEFFPDLTAAEGSPEEPAAETAFEQEE